ncbi:MAG: PqqD family protein [Thermodesulfobacteriota bacterium]
MASSEAGGRPPPAGRMAALACVPVRSLAVAEERLAGGLVRLSYPVQLRPWLARLVRGLGLAGSPQRRPLDLDRLGTAVWDLVDGHRTVAEVAAAFARQHRLEPREAELPVAAFLRELGRRGIIGLADRGGETPPARTCPR